LEHHRAVAFAGRQVGYVAVAEADRPAGHIMQAGDHAQQRRLPATRRPEQEEQLAGLDLKGYPVDRNRVAEVLGDLSQCDGQCGHGGSLAWKSMRVNVGRLFPHPGR
jgi:hypothetical protein